ncbi:MAG: VWA domain-containing protein [Rhodoferax sp.]|nr:VWA domain-containing protein [Rhodoferax sp.]
MPQTMPPPPLAPTPPLLFSPVIAAVPASGGTLDLIVRVQAPDQPADPGAHHRPAPPKRLALVVDRSGSMSGRPLSEALRCVEYIASRMTPADQLAVVLYDDQVQLLRALAPVTSLSEVTAALAGIESGGSTDLFAGWEAGARQLEGGTAGDISRVLLLSDGQANHGVVNPATIEQHCQRWLARGVSTSTVGLGQGFNENLMVAMARAGGGQQYYGQTAQDLHDNFDEEFSLLQALCLRQLDLSLIPGAGVIVEALGLVQRNPDGSYRLPDQAWGAEVWLALRLHVSPSMTGQVYSQGSDTRRDLLAVSLQARTLEGTTVRINAPLLSLPVLHPEAMAALPVDESVQRRLLEVAFAQASQTLRDLAQTGRVGEVRAMMDDLQAGFGHHPWLRDKLDRLRILADDDLQMMAKEVHYSAMRMSRRNVAKSEMAYSVDETASLLPAFLRKKAEEGKGRSR